jgi:hypothetical protein
MWTKNAFDEWHEFWGFEMNKFIKDLLEGEQFVMVLFDMLAIFIFQVAKKDNNMYLPMRFVILIFFVLDSICK